MEREHIALARGPRHGRNMACSMMYTHISLADIKGASTARRVVTMNGGKEVRNEWSQYGPRTVTSVSRISRSKDQKWMLTITRTLDNPNQNSVTETEQIIYLLKPGLEEGKVATWLNHITTALHSLAPSFRGMNTRSRTRTLADTQCLWSAEFATKPAPADVKMKKKPNIALLWKDPFDPLMGQTRGVMSCLSSSFAAPRSSLE
jgi:hypothetical protein